MPQTSPTVTTLDYKKTLSCRDVTSLIHAIVTGSFASFFKSSKNNRHLLVGWIPTRMDGPRVLFRSIDVAVDQSTGTIATPLEFVGCWNGCIAQTVDLDCSIRSLFLYRVSV